MKRPFLPFTLPLLAAGLTMACAHRPTLVATAQAEVPAPLFTTIKPEEHHTVFVLDRGKTYHTGQCTDLAGNAVRTAMPLEKAYAEGLNPCTRCKPE